MRPPIASNAPHHANGISYRVAAQKWYSSRRWKAKRERQLSAHPLCKMCLEAGIATAATIADHRIPHKGDYDLFWDGELDSLCKRHHDSDKAIIEGGKAVVRIGEDGWPIGPDGRSAK